MIGKIPPTPPIQPKAYCLKPKAELLSNLVTQNRKNRPFFSPVLEPCFFRASGEGKHSEEWSTAQRPVGAAARKKTLVEQGLKIRLDFLFLFDQAKRKGSS